MGSSFKEQLKFYAGNLKKTEDCAHTKLKINKKQKGPGNMRNIIDTWKKVQLSYQQRYAKYARKNRENPNDKENLGHLHECSYVLITIFGLTSKQVEELEQNDFAGFTNKDIDTF